ncbi:hypothetical protein EIP91_005796 [Steccherinum ochraceum]|uniref:Sas10 C-terminal domain-containing protein n=1 Tax=Steccherinum ochraceum TaxID=92696 RepID=A0A4R0R6N7_9APHY|nr:hypothetical protein EIP91_005796 [Steccherinum ochraceum]
MARKHGSKPSGSKPRPSRPLNKKNASIKRWETADDIPEDEIDRFHNSKDRILLDGESGNIDEDEDDDEEEVFALKGMPEDSDEDSSDDGDGLHDGDEDDEMDDAEPIPGPSKSKKSKSKKNKASPPSSEASGSESEDEGWGKKKSEYYASNADQIESDDEEANELEEQEAKRLQLKARENLAEDDFGLGDSTEILAVEADDILDEPPEPAVAPLPQDKPSLLRHLEKTNPEALALARDWEDVAYTLTETQGKIQALEAEDPDALSLGMAHLHYQALQTYATTLAFYLYLRSTEKYVARPELLRAHPIMARLLTLKQSIATLEDLGFNLDDEDEDEDEIDEGKDAEGLWRQDYLASLGEEELEELMIEARQILGQESAPSEVGKPSSETEVAAEKKKKKKSKKAQKLDNADGEAETIFTTDEPPKKKRKSSTSTPVPVFDLVEPTFPSKPSSSRPSKSPTADSSADPYGELTVLSSADAQDKASRKRSLRFHTSKIESASARREKARSGAYGGDDDIPWKDRRKEKKVSDAQRGMGGDDLDDVPGDEKMAGEVSSNGAGGKQAREEDEDGGIGESDDEGYYDLVKRKSKEKKEKKKADYEARAEAERVVPDDDSSTGPRGLTRAILSNKGLTPHRSKSVRNPRVKKRQKFEKAKKKVSSQKAVFKGGVSSTGGRYDGEKSGISKVVKSVKL